MHIKREIVCTGLPEAMLIKSTALTKTRMAQSRTALRGMRPVSVLSNLFVPPHDLNRAIPFLILNPATNSDGRPTHKLKFIYTSHLYNLYNLFCV